MLLQRVKHAAVTVNGREVSKIGPGLLGFVGFGLDDDASLPDSKKWRFMLKKLLELRIFPDEAGKLNKCVTEYGLAGGEILLVSQFTLYADCRKGRRPSFHPATPPDVAQRLFSRFVADMEGLWPGKVRSGLFGEDMDVSLTNWGPVTIMLSSDALGI